MAVKIISPPVGSDGASPVKKRYGTIDAVAVNTVLADCDVIDMREFEAIAVKPSASITSLVVYASETATGTFVIVESIGTSGSVTVVAARWNVLDVTKIPPFGFLKLVPNTNGTVEVVGKT